MAKVSNEDKRYDYIVVVASDARGNAPGGARGMEEFQEVKTQIRVAAPAP